VTGAWQVEPAVLGAAGGALALFAQAFVRLRRRGRVDHAGGPRAALFVLAVALGTLALASPIDRAADSYLSAHMLQHVLIGDAVPALALVALRGPLVFFLLPAQVLRRLARLRLLRGLLGFLLRPSVGLTAWTAAFGAWHVPAAYDYALRHQAVHDLEHVSFLAAGLLVWAQLVDPARRRALRLRQRLGYAAALFGFAAVLADVLLVSGPLYPAYADRGDQQLAGLVMLGEQLLSLALCAGFLLAKTPQRAIRRSVGVVWPPALLRRVVT
jgi:putative membrane protein